MFLFSFYSTIVKSFLNFPAITFSLTSVRALPIPMVVSRNEMWQEMISISCTLAPPSRHP